MIIGVSRDVTAAGSSALYLALVPLVAAVDSSTALRLAVGYCLLMGVCYGIKAAFFKPRPDHADSPAPKNRIESIDASSFPSAHSARAATIAWVIGTAPDAPLLLGLGLAVGAIAVGVSRVILRRHTAMDVLAGWVIGIAAAAASIQLGVI